MGGLSSGPGPGICFLTLCLLLLAQQSQSAPVQEDNLSQQPRAQGYYDGSSSELSSGCYYNFQHYGEGDRIITNEPCLNCTCRNRMLMCYLRVCPFTKAIGQNCTIEKKPGQCCPLIVCPEVPVQLLTSSTTTEHSESMSHKTQLGYGHYGTAIGHLDDYGCRINGEFYTNGAQIPGNIDKPCEVCYCIRNRTACIMQECTLQVEGCIPVYEEGLCCPVRYQCDYEYSYNAITTEQPRPTPGLVLTTTSGPFECHHDGKWYADGSSVDTEDPCEHCYCMKGDIVCAVQECKPPFEKDGHNCTAMPPAPGKCCPDSYHCDGNEIVAASETTFRQDRMHKFGRNNANVTMSITSSTSSTDKHHGWHYGTNANEKDTPNRFTNEQNKDGTTGENGQMMVTEGMSPTPGPLESDSHHLEGYFEGKPVSEGHGVNTDNMLTISQVIHSIVQNQTQLLNQNRLNQSAVGSGKPGDVAYDDKIHFPVDQDGKRPSLHIQTDEDGNPLESHSTATELPEDYYGFTGGSSDIYAEHSGRPQTRPTKPAGVATGTGKPQPGQAIFGEHGHFGRPIKRPGAAAGGVTSGDFEGTDRYQGTTELPEGWTGQPGKRPITHKVPGSDGTSVMTDEVGNPMEGVTGQPEGFTGKPGSGIMVIYYDEHGRPHRRPAGHKQPGLVGSDQGVTNVHEGMTGLPEGFTGRPGAPGTYVYYDKNGRPHKRPVGQKQPGDSTTYDGTATGLPEGFTMKPEDQLFGEHGHSGRPIKKPVVQKRPGLADETGATGSYDESTGYPEGFTGRPGVHGRPGMTGSEIMTNQDGVAGTSDGYTGRPGSFHKHPNRPGIHMRPGMEDGMTEVYEGTTEESEGYTSQIGLDIIYGGHGHGSRPQKRPGMTETVTNKDGTLAEGVTGMPEIFGEHGHTGRPHKKPAQGSSRPEGVKVTTDEDGNIIEEMTETPQSHTGQPDNDELLVHYGEQSRPKPGSQKKPGQTMTDKDGNAIEGVTGSPEYHTDRPESGGMQIIYDKYGRPHRRPVHKKPAVEGEVTTGGYGDSSDEYEGTTETVVDHTVAQDYIIMYDNHGRPIKMPVHKTPGMHAEYMPVDKDKKPVEGMTETPEGHTGKPDSDDYVIFYDQFGKPHKMPVGHKRPGVQVLHGKPVQEQDGMTESPDGHVATSDGIEYTIVYDSYGRPVKRPVHTKPGMDDEHTTDKYENSVYGTTKTPESNTGKPDADDMELVYDEHGRPIKPGYVHKKPGPHGQEDTADELTGTTETPEGHTETPDHPGFIIVYDKNGRPYKKPIRQKPGMHGELAPTDKYGKPIEGITETPDSQTDKPDTDGHETVYDQFGRPIKPGVSHMKPGEHDDDGKPMEEFDGTTETAEDHTGTYGDNEYIIVYDKHGRPIKRPAHHKPGMHDEHATTDKYGHPVEGTTELPYGHTGRPDSDDEESVYDHYGRPIKRPVHTKPGMDDATTDKYGKPIDQSPDSQTGRPGVDETPEIFGEHGHTGRPHKKPSHTTVGPHGVKVTTDEDGNVIEGMTEVPESGTVKPGSEGEVHYDGHGRPKPGDDDDLSATDAYGKPVGEHEGGTETPEGHTETPDHPGFIIVYDKNGRPYKKPIRQKPGMHGELAPTDKYGKPIEGITETPDSQTSKPENELIFDEHGRPKPSVQKKPGDHTSVDTDEHGKPLEDHEIITESPEGHTNKPDSDSFILFFDQYGRPHRRPIQKKPGSVLTDEEGNPLEGAAETTPNYTERPEIPGFFGEHGHTGRPFKRPGMTPDNDQTVDYEGTTGTPDEFTGRPGSNDKPEIFGEHGHVGRPHKRPVTNKKPVAHDSSKPSDDETNEYQSGRPHKKPDTIKPEYEEDVTELPQGHTGRPETDSSTASISGEHGQTGRPHKRPIVHGKPDEDLITEEDGNPIEEATNQPEDYIGSTNRPGEGQTLYGVPGRPQKRPTTQKRPVKPGMTEEDESIELQHGTTEMTGLTSHDGVQTLFGENGRPLKKPGTHLRPEGTHDSPGEYTTTDDFQVTTETPVGQTSHPLFGEHGHLGRPQHKPVPQNYPEIHGLSSTQQPQVSHETSENGEPEIYYDENGQTVKPLVHKQPGELITDEDGKPVDGHGSTTEETESQTGIPDYNVVYDKNGRPIKIPIRQKPGMHGVFTPTDKYGKPIEGITEIPDSQTGKPDTDDHETVYDQFGRPIKPGVSHMKPGEHDDDGKPMEEFDGTTETPEDHTGTYDDNEYIIVYDKHGRPIKRPVHKKPGMDDDSKPTDKYGQTVEVTTEIPEGNTEKPDYIIMYDNHGRPIKMPVHKTPGMHAEYMPVDKDKKPVEGMTETPEGHTGKPDSDDYVIFYDQFGKPHKMPVGHKRPGSTEGIGHPSDEEGHTSKPDSSDIELEYDEHGKPLKPGYVHKKPGPHGQDDTADEVTGTTETPEGHTETPDHPGFIIVYDKNGRPHKKPIRQKPGIHSELAPTDKYGKPIEGITEIPDSQTDKPDTDDHETVYDQFGRPIKPGVSHMKPGEHDDDGKPMEEFDGTTETAEDHTGTYDDNEYIIVYDKHGRPIKRPVHTKPGMDDATTDKYGKPIDQSPDSQTGRPGLDETPEIFDEHGHTGRPHKKPSHTTVGPHGVKVTTDEDGNVIEGMTEVPESGTVKPGSDGEVHYDVHGRPKPGTHLKPGDDDDLSATDAYGKPVGEHEGGTESPEGHTETPDHPGFIIVYDKNGRPYKKPIRQKPGMHGELAPTDKYGKPIEGITETPDSQTGKPDTDGHETVYDQFGRPIKPGVSHMKPGEHDDDGKPMEEFDGTTETPEDHTGTYDDNEYIIVYDKHGRPIKRPAHHKPGMHDEHATTDKYGHPVEGTTELPYGHTGRPDSDDEESVYDHYGRPIKRPVHKKPGMDDATTDKYGKPIDQSPDSQTDRPGLDETPEIFGEHGHTGRPHKKPSHTTVGPHGVKVTTDEDGNVIEGMTEVPESGTVKPGSDGEVHYDGHGRPKPGDGATGETPEGHDAESGSDASVTDHVEHSVPEEKPSDGGEHPPAVDVSMDHTEKPVVDDEHGHPGVGQHTVSNEDMDPFHGLGVITMKPDDHSEKPESDSLLVIPDEREHLKPHEKPVEMTDHVMGSTGRPHETFVDQKKPVGVADDAMTPVGGVESHDHTKEPGSDDRPMVFGVDDPSGRPQTRPIKPGAAESPFTTETAEGEHTTRPNTEHDEEGRPIVQDVQETTQDGLPDEGSTVHGDEEETHKKPEDVEEHSPGMHDVKPEEGLEPHSKPEDDHMGTEMPANKKPGVGHGHTTASPEESSTPSNVDTHFQEFGRPHQRPVEAHPTSTDESEVHNEVPDDVVFGESGHTGRPTTKPDDDETQTTEASEGFSGQTDGTIVHYDNQSRPLKKPGTSDVDAATEEPEKDSDAPTSGTEPNLFGEHGRPQKKPVLKPGSHLTDVSDHTEKEPDVEDHTGVHGVESTEKPEHDSSMTVFGESGRPTKKPTRPVHEDHKPEENEISVGDKGTEAPKDHHVTGKPEGTKVAEPTHEIEEGSDGTRPEGELTTEHPEGIWQYLPPKKPVTPKEPEETGKPDVKPSIQPTDGLTVPEEDSDEDDSLIITTDEPEEETEDAHSQPTAHEVEQPTDTKTKIPEESDKPHSGVQSTTPGFGSQPHDFTTSGYGSHDSSLPVTDEAIHGHPVTQGLDGHPDLSHLGPDGVSFPGANVVFDKEGKPHIIPGHHSESTPGISHVGMPVSTPGYEDKLSTEGGVEHEDDGHHDEQPESVTGVPGSKPEEGSTPGVTVIFGEDGRPHIVPAQETTPGLKGKPDGSHPEVGKPAGTPEDADTTEKKPAYGQFPGLPAGFLPSFSETGTPNTDAPIMIDGGLNEGSPFDAVLDSLANVLRPMQTTEKTAETTESHEEVPGEGNCFVDGVTYPNNSDVPPLSPCHTKCTCISSIIHCLSLKCPSPPEDVSQCTTVHDEKSCCPTYICGESSTTPVEGQEVTTVASEDEHGLVQTEVSVKPEDEENPPIKASEGKPHDDGHPTTADDHKPTSHQTEKPDDDHTKPEIVHAHPDNHSSNVESEPGITMPGPVGIPAPGEEDEAPTRVKEGQTTDRPEESIQTKPGRPQISQSGYLPPSSDEHHPSTLLPSYFGTGKPVTTAEEHPDYQRPDSDNHVLGTDEPGSDDKKPHHEGTEEHKPDQPMTEEEDQKPSVETGESDSPTKKPFEEVEHEKPTISDGQPSTDEQHVDKPDVTSASEDHTPTDEVHGAGSHEKPDGSLPTKKKPQEGQMVTPTEETDDHVTHKPEDDGQTSEEHEESHKKPSVHHTSLDTFTTTSPHERPIAAEESETGVEGVEHPTSQRPDVHGEEEPTDVKPGHDSMSSETPESGDVTSTRPVTHDTDSAPSEEDKDGKPHLSPDQSEEQGHTPATVDQSGKPLSTVQLEESRPEYDSADKVHTTTELATDHSTSEDEVHHEKPEGVIGEEADHTTVSPHEKFGTSKPMTPSGVLVDSQKKPEVDSGEGHESTSSMDDHTEDEKPHKKPGDGVSLMEEDSAHSTSRPQEEPSKETEYKPESTHPSSVDSESELTTVGPHVKPVVDEEDPHKSQTGEHSDGDVHTTERPHEVDSDGHKPHVKPEVDFHTTSMDEETGHFTTSRPHGEPTEDTEEPHKRPEDSLDDLGSPSTKPPVTQGSEEVGQEKPEHEEHQPDVSHPTTEGVMVHGKPEHDFSSTMRPRPGQSTSGYGSHKPQPAEIPEEVLLHPTRTPGTFQTHRPDMDADNEPTDHKPDAPVVDQTTVFPDGFFGSITKRPTIGADKTGSKPEESVTHRPHTDRPEGTPEGTGKPIHDLVTELPDNFADVFGTFKPTPVHGQPGQKPDFGDFQPGTMIFQRPDLPKPDEDLEEHEIPEGTTPHEEYPSQYTTIMPGVKPGPWKRPIYSTNGTHFIQYVPVKEGEIPTVPQGAMLGEQEEGPDGEKYWPIIYVKSTPSITESSTEPQKPVPQQAFNGTHYVQYVPFNDGEKPEVPEGATLGQPIKRPDGQVYWPVIDTKPITSHPEDEPITQEPFPGQVYNGTHFIQYLPYNEEKPEVPEGAVLGQPQVAPNGEKYWPIISTNPIPDEEGTTTGSVESQPEQIFNGTHFIQYVPFKDGEAPDIPEEATLGQPQKGPDGQIYWPIINTKPIPVTPSEDESTTHVPPVQVFNGTNFIQYVPFKDGEAPDVPEGATLGQPQKTPDGEIYWPIIYAKPQPVKPEGSLPGQVFNGTHYIQYVPYEEDKKPEVPEGATLGNPQKTPDGQTFWPLIYSKPVTTKPEDQPTTTEEPFALQLFNGTHFIQYIPFTEGFEPQLPEEATMGAPITRPDGQKYWPIIYEQLPTTAKPEDVQPHLGQVYNGTHFIKYIPYRPNYKPQVPEGATVGDPVKGSDEKLYRPIISTKPLSDLQEDPVKPQVYNGTHYIQYVPYEEEKPEVPEEATLGELVTRPDGQKYWPVISKKPLPGLPITTQQGPLEDELSTTEPVTEQVFNGTHYIQYVPYEPGKQPTVPEGADVGKPTKGPDDQMYWPIVHSTPVPGLPVTTQGLFDDDMPTTVPVKEQVYNGTHYIQYVPYKPGQRPVIAEDATLGKPVRRPDNQLYWPIIRLKPVPGLPITTQQGPVEDELTTAEPVTEQVFNGTHYIQYVPYKPGQRPVIPEEATLGNPVVSPNNEMYWPIIYLTPVPDLPITTQSEPFQDAVPTSEPVTQQVFNGTHYIQYVPYKPGQRPVIPDEATLGKPTKGPNNQMYWPIIYQKPVSGLPITSPQGLFDDETPTTVSPSKQFFNGTHYIQYVPYKPGKRPLTPEGATLGKPTKGPNDQMFWPIIYLTPVPGVPVTTQSGIFEDMVPTTEQVTEQVFNGTHYIQYVPYKPGQRPVIPEEATLGKPTKGPDDQMYWPIVHSTPVPGLPVTTQGLFDDDMPTTVPVKEQVYNGTHYIQYVPYKPGQRPVIAEDATLGKPVRRPDNQLYWPIIRLKPVPGLPITTQQGPVEDELTTAEPVTEQVFNGTHYIQYVPYEPGKQPTAPEGATLGKPTRGPDDQMYWPIIHSTPVPGLPIAPQSSFEDEMPIADPTKGQVYNGTHYIQYVPYKPGKRPSVPEGAKLGKPTKGPNDQMYWPVIHLKPVPGLPIVEEHAPSFDPTKGQVFNGTHYIQYVPYRPMHRPVVPSEAKLGKPTRGPNGQMYWPIIYTKPIPGIPIVTEKPLDQKTPEKGQYFNGTHYIQYVPYASGHKPVVPEGATLGQPVMKPDGQMYWPIVRSRPLPGIPINWMPYEYTTPRPEQIFNGTHYIQYLPYNPTQMPEVPEGAMLGHPQKGPGGQMYWVLISDKPIPVQTFNGTHVVQYVTPVTPEQDKPDVVKPFQVFNGTHYIQYVPYRPGQRPVVPEGAVLGKPTKGPEGETYWPIIYKKRPVGEVPSAATPVDGQIFNGTHFIRYVPYNPSKRPYVPEGATISKPESRPDGQKYWVISSRKPLPAIDDEPVQVHPGQIYNGTHYIQYVPYNPSQMPQVPDGAVLGHPQKGPEGEMNWVIISDKPLPAQTGTQYVQYVTPVTPEENKFSTGLIHNGTHYIQYVPYKPAQIPHIPNDATLGDLEQGPGGQMYWPIIYKQPPQKPFFNGTHYITYAPQNGSNVENSTKDHPFWDYGQYGGTKVKPSSTTEGYPSWLKPGQNGTKHPTQEQSKPGYNEYESGYNKPDKRPGGDDSFEGIDEDHLIEYPSGSDYDETQEQPYGPGTCRYAGKVYVSAQQIPRDDPCDFCFCFRSDIICLQQSCPPPIPGCHEEPIQGFCCPRYECHVRMATLLNVTSTTTTTTTTLPPHFLSHVYKGAAGRTGCFFEGRAYRVGQPISSASGPCMDCICGGDGRMKCEPKVCTPEPMVRQMMVSTEKAMTANQR